MILSTLVLGLVTVERLAELVWARRNTRRLLAQGAHEAAAGHYPLIVILHAAWLVGLWVLATLGERWTTRIIVLPGEALVRQGPYRLIPHPNYAVVAGEILVLPLVFGLLAYGFIFSILNAAVLVVRIRAEEKALSRALP